MNFDLAAVFAGRAQLSDLTSDLKHADLRRITDEFFDTINSILAAATDAAVSFVPRDPAASDQSGQGWTLSHIVAHLTATLEESAAIAAMVARGVQFEGRLRYETPWQEISTLQLLQARLRESRRMCCAFLEAWPDNPHLDVTRTMIPQLGPINAVGCQVLGLAHSQAHLDQLRDTLCQYLSSVDA
ncbi:DinB family protein [Ktedonosporobacter rubrisoli]|uniref:DinB family protein n=1 Tax=Ktedonosporobacter rubrisoli TaxID=2509675 RepID=A0A4P6JN69_KTERU|nr:DinB family protein [Ktedonosporobacter rubrisoli]QBD76739.1 DinB family protein [Ktedonosporobacter rubrisoli]